MRPKFQSKNVKIGFFALLVLVAIVTTSLILSGIIAFGQSPTPSNSPSPAISSSASPSISPSLSSNITPPRSAAPRLQTQSGEVVSISANMTSFLIQPDNHFRVIVNVDQNTKYFKVNVAQALAAMSTRMMGSMMRPRDQGQGNQGALPLVPGMPNMAAIPGMINGMMNQFDDLTQFSQPATFSDIAVGKFVIVRGMSANNLAKQVFIISVPKVVLGNITALSSSSITITPFGGTAVTLSWDGNTWFILKGVSSAQTGQMAIAAYDNDSKMAIAILAGASFPMQLPSRAPNLTPGASPSNTMSPAATPSATISTTLLASPSASPTPTTTIDASTFLGKTITLSVGATLAINLPSNPSTGFSWELVQISDNSVLQKVSNQLNPAPSAIPGAPGTETWTFKALKAGTTGLFMQYSQPFTGGTKGAQTLALTIIVQ